MGRKLAHIEKIEWIRPIEGKDRIVLAGVLGWTVIVQKSDYKEGDLCVFCEIDSVFPEKPEFEFLRKKNFRIRTMKMAGVLSQGIYFPLSMLPAGSYHEGDDVTELMGITQYEATQDKGEEGKTEAAGQEKLLEKYPRFLTKFRWFRALVLPEQKSRDFPDFISKTDEPRIQNVPYLLQLEQEFVATEKVDGQSGTFVLRQVKGRHFWRRREYEFLVCSRNYRLPEKDTSSYWKAAQKYDIEKVLRSLIGKREWVAIQGECVAPFVQGNKYHVTGVDLYVFNLVYPEGRVGSLEAKKTVEQYGMKFVPIVAESVKLTGMSVAEVLDYATGDSRLYSTLREGIVFRSQDGKQSFKAVSPEFLILHGE